MIPFVGLTRRRFALARQGVEGGGEDGEIQKDGLLVEPRGQSLGVGAQKAASPFRAAGRAGATRRRIIAAQSVGAKEHLPLLARRLGRPQRQRQQPLAVIAPAANRLQPRFPTMIERRANEQPPQARQLGLQSARQRVAMPVIPGIFSERRASAHRVEVGIEFGFRRRSRV